MKISGIYQIQSRFKPERIYIGSAVQIKSRWCLHLASLRKNKHHSLKLQHHYNKYGESDLEFSILLPCEKKELINKEQFFIDSLTPYFNICKTAGSTLGVIRTNEYKEKQKVSHTGKKNNRWGVKLTPEHRQILLDSNENRVVSEETKDKIRITRLNTTASQETKDKMSKQRIGKPTPMAGLPAWNKGKKDIYLPETIQKIKDARAKQIFSEESQRKKSETMKRIWKERKLKAA